MGEEFLYANPYNAALNYGDGSGAAYEAVARPRQTPGPEVDRLAADAPQAYTAIRTALATLDLADSAIIAGTDQTGQLRYNGRKEGDAIVALETDVVDPASDQSATAVLDKISGRESDQHAPAAGPDSICDGDRGTTPYRQQTGSRHRNHRDEHAIRATPERDRRQYCRRDRRRGRSPGLAAAVGNRDAVPTPRHRRHDPGSGHQPVDHV
jgi:hypothetical protein